MVNQAEPSIKDIWIHTMEFVRVTTDKLEGDGLPAGSIVMVGALKALPVSEEDPWTQRIKLFVHKTENDYVDVAAGIFVIDPTSVEKLSEEENERIYKVNQERADATTH